MKNISNINIITIIILIFVILAVIYHNFYDIKQSSNSNSVKKIKSNVLMPSYWKKGNKISFKSPPNHYHAEYSPHNFYN